MCLKEGIYIYIYIYIYHNNRPQINEMLFRSFSLSLTHDYFMPFLSASIWKFILLYYERERAARSEQRDLRE